MTDTATLLSGAADASELSDALARRATILEMTQTAEEAVLRPEEPGGWSHPVRAAMAARIATLSGDGALAGHHGRTAGSASPLSDPHNAGDTPRIRAALRFTDAAAGNPRDMTADDVTRLQGAGINDADIVRLAELNAFLAYQVRLIAGLRLLAGRR